MDRIDEEILRYLRQHSRMTSSEIGKRVHLSIPAVAERIRKLEEAGVIERFTVKTNRDMLGLGLLAFIMVELRAPEHTDSFRDFVRQVPAVLECHHIAGSCDYLLKAAVKNTAELEELISVTLKQSGGVSKTNTMIVLSTVKEEI